MQAPRRISRFGPGILAFHGSKDFFEQFLHDLPLDFHERRDILLEDLDGDRISFLNRSRITNVKQYSDWAIPSFSAPPLSISSSSAEALQFTI